MNPLQIFELSSGGPDNALNLISKMKATTCRILVAGGDGTIGWILNEIVKKNIQPIPEVCILPIGTGNDLSRVLGWGGVPPTALIASELCEKVCSDKNKHKKKQFQRIFFFFHFLRFETLNQFN